MAADTPLQISQMIDPSAEYRLCWEDIEGSSRIEATLTLPSNIYNINKSGTLVTLYETLYLSAVDLDCICVLPIPELLHVWLECFSAGTLPPNIEDNIEEMEWNLNQELFGKEIDTIDCEGMKCRIREDGKWCRSCYGDKPVGLAYLRERVVDTIQFNMIPIESILDRRLVEIPVDINDLFALEEALKYSNCQARDIVSMEDTASLIDRDVAEEVERMRMNNEKNLAEIINRKMIHGNSINIINTLIHTLKQENVTKLTQEKNENIQREKDAIQKQIAELQLKSDNL
jgi:hypothetical protein